MPAHLKAPWRDSPLPPSEPDAVWMPPWFLFFPCTAPRCHCTFSFVHTPHCTPLPAQHTFPFAAAKQAENQISIDERDNGVERRLANGRAVRRDAFFRSVGDSGNVFAVNANATLSMPPRPALPPRRDDVRHCGHAPLISYARAFASRQRSTVAGNIERTRRICRASPGDFHPPRAIAHRTRKQQKSKRDDWSDGMGSTYPTSQHPPPKAGGLPKAHCAWRYAHCVAPLRRVTLGLYNRHTRRYRVPRRSHLPRATAARAACIAWRCHVLRFALLQFSCTVPVVPLVAGRKAFRRRLFDV